MAETVFVRSSKTRDYTVIDNHFLRDDTLSAQAKGLMAYLLFLPEDWTIYQSELCKHFSNGRDSIRSITKELEEHGYLLREKLNGEKGRFGGYKFTIIENPLRENRDGLSAAVNPSIPNTNIKPNTDKPISTNSVGPDFPTEESVEKKQTFKKADYQSAYEAYKTTAQSIGKQNTYFNIRQINTLLKNWFKEIGVEKTIECIRKASSYDFVKSTGFEFSTILSAGCFTKLINNTYGYSTNKKNQNSVDAMLSSNSMNANEYSIDDGRF